MAVAYRAIQCLNNLLYNATFENKSEKGGESVLSLMDVFMNYSLNYVLYSETILAYMSLNRSSSEGKVKAKMTAAIRESVYWLKLQDIQNIAFNLVVNEIKRGKADGSIKSREKPELLYLIAWANVVGFMKLNVASGRENDTLHGVPIKRWKKYHIDVARSLLESSK